MQMPVFARLSAWALTVGALVASAGARWAALGQPTPWQLGFQQAATPVMDDITWFHDFLLCDHHRHHALRAGAARLIVDGALQRQRQSDAVAHHPQHAARGALDRRAGRHPGRHRDPVVPAAVLRSSTLPKAGPHHQGDRQPVVLELRLSRQRQLRVRLRSCVEDKDRKPDQPRLLAVDNEMVVPVNKVVRVQVTGADVIHAFAVPSFGIKIDAVPGRLNETWFKATKRRRLLRPVLGTVRQGPRLHADRGPRRERQASSAAWVDAGEEEIRRRRRARRATTVAAAGATAR